MSVFCGAGEGGCKSANQKLQLEYTISNTVMTGDKSKDEGKIPPQYQAIPLSPATEWLKPGPAYILPTSGFFFGGNGSQASLVDFLPSRLAADKLIRQYFACVHPICQIVHRPSFEQEWDAFWDDVTLGIEPSSSVQAIVFAAMFSGVVSMAETEIMREFGVSKVCAPNSLMRLYLEIRRNRGLEDVH